MKTVYKWQRVDETQISGKPFFLKTKQNNNRRGLIKIRSFDPLLIDHY